MNSSEAYMPEAKRRAVELLLTSTVQDVNSAPQALVFLQAVGPKSGHNQATIESQVSAREFQGAENTNQGAVSSVGRASGLHPEGHRFEPCTAH